MAKANPIAAAGSEMAFFPDDAMLFDDEEVTAERGGVVEADGEFYSLSRPELVFEGNQTAEKGDILLRRTGRITLASYPVSQPTTFGGEAEYAVLDRDTGEYSDRLGFDLELYTFMAETGTRVADSPEDLHKAYAEMSSQAAGEAEDKGVLLSPVSVFGQREARPDEASANPYVQQVVRNMDGFTGFSAVDMFRVAGLQPHTRISNLPAALKAAEAMQLLNPILSAPSLAGPFLVGGRASMLPAAQFTGEQQDHLRRGGIREEDLYGRYQSYRYLLRRIGSPSSGIWTEPAPDSVEAYLADGHQKLAKGEINTIDRFRGWHADRVRAVLDGSDNTTFEGCSYDTFAGNIQAITDNHTLYSAVFTALEAAALRGEDVVEKVAKELGVDHMDRQGRLHHAHRAMLAVSRYGNDAEVYGKTPGQWLSTSVLPLAETAPHIEIDVDRRLRLLGNFATMRETAPALRQWCVENKTTPNMQAYYDLGLNAPAVYMRLERDSLTGGMNPREKAREVEHSVAKAFHAHVGQVALA
jgi:hypothetical protein